MRKGNWRTGIVWAGVSVLLLIWAAAPTAGQPVDRAPARWEYKTLAHAGPGQPGDEALNQLGADGWELVSVAAPLGRQELLHVFKRPRQR